MKLEQYDLISEDSTTVFEFISKGPKGEIHKLVKFAETSFENLYQLVLGDKNPKTGKISFSVISDNSDTEKVLSTVTATIYAFTNKHSQALIYAAGSTKSRTRLYRIGLTKYLAEIKKTLIYMEEPGGNGRFLKKE